jgi:4-amino-4-deoxy-L-arabinose transferase-like glycosyltransferase
MSADWKAAFFLVAVACALLCAWASRPDWKRNPLRWLGLAVALFVAVFLADAARDAHWFGWH